MEVKCGYDDLVPIADLRLNDLNPNRHSKDQIKTLAKILKYQGWTYSVNVSKLSGFVNTGHGRIEAAILNKWTHVPVKYIDFKDESQELANMISDNAIAEWADLDFKMINVILPDIGPLDIELLGIKDFEVEPADKESESGAESKVERDKCDHCGQDLPYA